MKLDLFLDNLVSEFQDDEYWGSHFLDDFLPALDQHFAGYLDERGSILSQQEVFDILSDISVQSGHVKFTADKEIELVNLHIIKAYTTK